LETVGRWERVSKLDASILRRTSVPPSQVSRISQESGRGSCGRLARADHPVARSQDESRPVRQIRWRRDQRPCRRAAERRAALAGSLAEHLPASGWQSRAVHARFGPRTTARRRRQAKPSSLLGARTAE
jgi:hypothetical protein